jgi:hypothetical protein
LPDKIREDVRTYYNQGMKIRSDETKVTLGLDSAIPTEEVKTIYETERRIDPGLEKRVDENYKFTRQPLISEYQEKMDLASIESQMTYDEAMDWLEAKIDEISRRYNVI